jgi:ATP-dependent RNA helicase DHX8/PRP22
VFLTGEDEIITLQKKLKKTATEFSLKIEILMLYSALPHEYQHLIFEKKGGSDTRRVILATNIAETSVTIPGVRYVVDCGFMKVRAYDNQKLFDILQIVPVSKANALQRTGRAGR